jgi:hypothetical protein
VWKVSYRLDLTEAKPRIQGWAIVDNSSDVDWTNVTLSLIAGQPVSFIQELYPPLYLQRPVVPLAIAGISAPTEFDSGYEAEANLDESFAETADAMAPMAKKSREMPAPAPMLAASEVRSAGLGAAQTGAATAGIGELFEFTLKTPVTLARQKSAMLALVDTNLKAEKLSVFSGAKSLAAGSIHPQSCAWLTNETGLKLPAGPITVFDGGAYAGDALLGFFPLKERRLIAYGEDLSVSGAVETNETRNVDTVRIAKGVMTFVKQRIQTRVYVLKNAADTDRTMLIEHPIQAGATLVEPAQFEEKTDDTYRFLAALPANKTIRFSVRERTPLQESVGLARLSLDSLLAYSSSGDIPDNARAALAKAAEFRRKVDESNGTLSSLQAQRDERIQSQERIRLNLEAVGVESTQGKEYLKKLAESDAAIERLEGDIAKTRSSVQVAQEAFDKYVSGLIIE